VDYKYRLQGIMAAHKQDQKDIMVSQDQHNILAPYEQKDWLYQDQQIWSQQINPHQAQQIWHHQDQQIWSQQINPHQVQQINPPQDKKTWSQQINPHQDQQINPHQDKKINPHQDQQINPHQDQQINPHQDQQINPHQDQQINPHQDQQINPPQDKKINPPQDKKINPPQDKRINPPQDKKIWPHQDKKIWSHQDKKIWPQQGKRIWSHQDKKIWPRQGKKIWPRQEKKPEYTPEEIKVRQIEFKDRNTEHSCGALLWAVNPDTQEVGIILGKEFGKWYPFKGTQHEGETFEQTAIREIYEETAGIIEIKTIDLDFEFMKNKKYHIGLVNVNYSLINEFNKKRNSETREHYKEKKSVQFFPINKLDDYKFEEITQKCVDNYKEQLLTY